MKKHIEIKTIEHKGVSVTMKVDYDNGTASLVRYEPHNVADHYPAKSYVFANRGLEYMNGWLNILEALQVAVKECKKDLEVSLAQSSAFKDHLLDMAESAIKVARKTDKKSWLKR